MIETIIQNHLEEIIIFLIILLIGVALVLIHYKKKYEAVRKEFGLINTEERKEEIRKAREELRKIYEKQSTGLFDIFSKIDKTLEVLEKS